MKRLDLIGCRFGFLTVVRDAGTSKRKASQWECACICGARVIVEGIQLKKGNPKSCGCKTREMLSVASTTHGMTGGPTWKSWEAMHGRCTRAKDISYPNYGGRGIAVCERWRSFENFLADMGERPIGMTIDRVDTNGDYEPGNCRWSTVLHQNRNKRNTKLSVDAAREIRSRTEAAKVVAAEYGVTTTTINRIRTGKAWP